MTLPLDAMLMNDREKAQHIGDLAERALQEIAQDSSPDATIIEIKALALTLAADIGDAQYEAMDRD